MKNQVRVLFVIIHLFIYAIIIGIEFLYRKSLMKDSSTEIKNVLDSNDDVL